MANRGEIAIRIFRAAELGLRTVAIYSLEDRFALHRFKADEAYQVKGAEPVRAYLGIEEILRVARAAGVDAIHPGYGFLAENPELADACVREGIIWVGPPKRVMERLGNKVEARRWPSGRGCRSCRPRARCRTTPPRPVGWPSRVPAHGQGELGRRRTGDADGPRPG